MLIYQDAHMEDEDHIEGEDAFPDDDENVDQGQEDQYGMFDDGAVDIVDEDDGEFVAAIKKRGLSHPLRTL
jgi:hypothetical protein